MNKQTIDAFALFGVKTTLPSPSPTASLKWASLFGVETTTEITPSPSPTTANDLFKNVKGAFDDEWDRIIHVPRVEPPDPKNVEWLHKGDKFRLRETQARALACIQQYKGLFGPIGVGHGKTLIAWLAPVVLGQLRSVIMMPPSMVVPFKGEVARFREHFTQPTNEPEIVSYSILSSANGTDLLTRMRPEVIIADEAHSLMHDTSARTKRLKRYFADNPNTLFIALSGTFFGKRPSDLAHLVQFSLQQHAFMPVRGRALDVWAQCVNLDGRPCDADWDAFAPLARAEGLSIAQYDGEERIKRARSAVLSRMQSAPGVISTVDPSIEIPINLRRHTFPVPLEIAEALRKVENGEETPDGEDIIVDDAQRARLANNLSAGFYYRWAWEEVGGRDEEWILARKTWHRALRNELEANSCEGYDSPMLVAAKVQRELDAKPSLAQSKVLHNAWSEWLPHRKKPVPPTVPVWISDFFVRWIEQFLGDGVPTLVWYYSRALGEQLGKLGLPVHGQGSDVPTLGASAACSISVHGTGKNLQGWWRNLVVELPTQAKTWEQLIGRTHRPGQPHDFVEFNLPLHTNKYELCLDKGIESAQHVKELTGADQRLLMMR